MSVDFVHLRTHSEYSVSDGLIAPEKLPVSAAERGMPAIALTDINNCFAMLKFYRSARACGVKPILGCEIRFSAHQTTADEHGTELILLVADERGYHNLFDLISKVWHAVRERPGPPRAERSWINATNMQGLIALSGAQYGDIGIALTQQPQEAKRCLDGWLEVFGDRFYIEVQRLSRAGEQAHLHASMNLAASSNCPVVATNAVCFLDKSDYEAHEARVCISEKRILGDGSASHHTTEQYLKSAQDMCTLFADIPEVLVNSVEIAKRCNVLIDLENRHLPHYRPLLETQSEEALLKEKASEGLALRLKTRDTRITDSDYQQRLLREIEAIEQAGFSGYFLVVMDFVRWALKQGIPVGPGRGSGAGSLVAWSLNITDVDPLRYGLLFERFLNPERIGLPDFDIDFCQDRRDEVMEYVRNHYGADQVAGIITFNRMAGRAVVRHVARVQGKAYAVGDRLARAMPEALGMKMRDMLTVEQGNDTLSELTQMLTNDDEAKEVWQMALSLEGLTHNVGRHAGGIVIAPDELIRYSPLYYSHDSESAATHYDKDDIEAVGLVKFDFLGLRTLTVIDKTERAINRAHPDRAEPLSASHAPLDDPDVYQLLCEANTVSLFQLESEGMRELLLRYRPEKFEDLIVLISLYRPGPLEMGMHTDYVERRSGRKKIDYYGVDALKPILADTYGVFLYQEQVMESARVLANYTLGEADILRRAMGKKKREEMAEQRQKFVSGAQQNGLDQRTANEVFDVMEKFSGYGFNKSHAAAYAMLAYRTAWLKVHYFPWFMAAEMSTMMTNTDQLEKLVRECRRSNVPLVPPNINLSDCEFEVDEDGRIIYALSAIKSIGRGCAELICEERKRGGRYKDMLDFSLRLSDHLSVHQAMLEVLTCAGCFDDSNLSRAALSAQIQRILDVVESEQRKKANGASDMFGESHNSPVVLDYVLKAGDVDDWVATEQLRRERAALGFYFSGHPLDSYRKVLRLHACVAIKNLKDYISESVVCIAGSVSGIKKIRRNTMAVLGLNDGSGVVEVRLSPELYDQYRDLVAEDKVLMVWGRVSQSAYSTTDYGLSCKPERIEEITAPPEQAQTKTRNAQALNVSPNTAQKHIVLTIDAKQCDIQRIQSLKEKLNATSEGDCMLSIQYSHPHADARFDLSRRVSLEGDFLECLRLQWGEHAVHIQPQQH